MARAYPSLVKTEVALVEGDEDADEYDDDDDEEEEEEEDEDEEDERDLGLIAGWIAVSGGIEEFRGMGSL